MTNTGTSGIPHQDKKFLGKISKYFDIFSTYRRYFKHFFLLVDRTSIGIECVIIFHRFSLVYAKYFTVYFRRTIKFDARVANLILYYSNVNVYVMTTMWRALNQRGLRRVYAQSLIWSFLHRFLGCL